MNYEDIIAEIKGVLELIRPYINRDGGDVEFVKFEDGIVYVRLSGACVGCAAVDSTMNDLIEDTLLERVPGVIGVELVSE